MTIPGNHKLDQPAMASQTVLIIGAKNGVGLDFAKKLKARGYDVYGTVRSLTEDEEELGPLRDIATEILEVDVLKEEMVEAAANAWGTKPLDLLIYVAGIDPMPFDWQEHTADDLMVKFQTNTVGPFLTIKYFYLALQESEQGKVINISSNMAAVSSLADNPEDARFLGDRLSKTALNQLTGMLGREFQSNQSNVTVNAIHPGWIPRRLLDWTGPGDMSIQTNLMIDTIEAFGLEDTGKYVNDQGEEM